MSDAFELTWLMVYRVSGTLDNLLAYRSLVMMQV